MLEFLVGSMVVWLLKYFVANFADFGEIWVERSN